MEIRLAQWTQALKERKANGESIDEFCQSKGVTRHQYFYWRRKVLDAACEQLADVQNKSSLPAPAFTEVMLAEPISQGTVEPNFICVEVDGYKITAGSAYPTEALAAILCEVVRPC